MKSTNAGRGRKVADAPEPSRPSPGPSLLRERVLESLTFAVATYREATRLNDQGWADLDRYYPETHTDEHYDAFQGWANFRMCFMLAARDRLMEGILIAHGRGKHVRDLKNAGGDWPACAWELDHVLYVVSQDPDDDDYHPVLAVVATKDFDADREDR